MFKLCEWLAANNRLLTKRVKELEGQFLQLQDAMIQVQSKVLGVQVMEIVDNVNMECLTPQRSSSNETHENISNGMAELPPLIGTNSLPPRSFEAVESGEDGVRNSGKVNAVHLEAGVNSATEWPRHCTKRARCDSGDMQKLEAESKMKRVSFNEDDGEWIERCYGLWTEDDSDDSTPGGSSSAEWPQYCARHVQCECGDEQKLEAECTAKHVSFNDDNHEWIERYDPKTKCWVKELWSEDDSDDYIPEVFKWDDGTSDGSESDEEWADGTSDGSESDEDDLQTMFYLDLLKQRQMEEELMKEKQKGNGGDRRQKRPPHPVLQNDLDKKGKGKISPYAKRRVRPHR